MDVVPLGQQLRDFVLGLARHGQRPGRNQNRIDVVEIRAVESLADGSGGHEHK